MGLFLPFLLHSLPFSPFPSSLGAPSPLQLSFIPPFPHSIRVPLPSPLPFLFSPSISFLSFPAYFRSLQTIWEALLVAPSDPPFSFPLPYSSPYFRAPFLLFLTSSFFILLFSF